MNKKLELKKMIISVVSLVILIEAVFLVANLSTGKTFSSRNVTGHADKVVSECSGSKFPPSCYDQKIPLLMDSLPLEDVIAVTEEVQKQDRRYLYCHVLGHYLSEREMRKDPTKWKEVLSKAPPTFCNNGFLHGALIARFSTDVFTDEMAEEIKPDLADVCEDRKDRKFVEVEKSMCYHAVGHLSMYVSNAKAEKAVAICGEVAVKKDGRNYTQTCTEGVFMQIYQPLEPEDFALVSAIAPKTKKEARDYCSQFEGESYGACNREAWPLWRTEIMKPGGVESFCSFLNNDLSERKCMGAVMNMVAATYVSDKDDFEGLNDYCLALSQEKYKRRCFANSATRLIQIDPDYTNDAIRICNMARKAGLEQECFRDLAYYGNFSFVYESKELKNYCNALPEEWQKNCLDKNDSWN